MEATRLQRTLSSVMGWKDASQFCNQRGVQQIADLLASVHFPALVIGCMELLQFLIGSLSCFCFFELKLVASRHSIETFQVAVRRRLLVRVFRTEHAHFEYFHPPNLKRVLITENSYSYCKLYFCDTKRAYRVVIVGYLFSFFQQAVSYEEIYVASTKCLVLQSCWNSEIWKQPNTLSFRYYTK